MKKNLLTSLCFLFLLFLSSTVHAATPSTPSPNFLEDEIVVKLKNSPLKSDMSPIAASIEGTIKKELLLKGTFVLKVPKGSVDSVLKILAGNSQIATATPNFVAEKMSTTNDPSLSKEWGLFQTQTASESAPSAWDKTTGKSDVKVAVLDTGIEKTHSDLKNKIVDEKNFTASPDILDHDGHGTHVAGIIAASGNNTIGIAGVAYGSSILNGKVLGDDGTGNYADIADGIIWAADNGAKVINLSLGGPVPAAVLEDAVNYAYSKGVVIVAAAGNSGINGLTYPAKYPHVISVAATDNADTRLPWSNYGTDVTVAAPGASIYSTYTNNSYASASGTSMATAFVSGEAALIWSDNICSSNECVINQIENTSDKIDNTGKYWKFGRVNILRALTESATDVTPTPSVSPSLTPTTEPEIPPIPGAISKPTDTPKPTPTLSPNTITVSNIDMWQTIQMTGHTLYIKVTTVKQSDKKTITGATVTLDLIAPSGKIFTGSTKTNVFGQAVFALRNINDLGLYTAKITSVKKTSYPYNATKTTANFLLK